MKYTAGEYIDRAGDLKSRELEARDRLDDVRYQRFCVEMDLRHLQAQLDDLYDELMDIDSDDEDSRDMRLDINSMILRVKRQIESCKIQEASLKAEDSELSAQLYRIEQEEYDILMEIEDSAARYQNGLSALVGTGDYAGVAARAADAAQQSLSKFEQAAHILGGSISMAGTGIRLPQTASGRSTGTPGAASRNLYEAAETQRRGSGQSAGRQSSLGRGATAPTGIAGVVSPQNESPKQSPKGGCFGKRAVNAVKETMGRLMNHSSNTATFTGFPAQKSPNGKDTWDIVGSGYQAFCEFRENMGSYTVQTEGFGGIEEIDPGSIEGIPFISGAEIKNPDLFWGRESGKNMDSFLAIASHIPEVREQLRSGADINDLLQDPRLGSCAAIYFCPNSPSAPTVTKGNGFYVFGSNGRHRILAARHFGYSFPMRVTGQIVPKDTSGGGLGRASSRQPPPPVAAAATPNSATLSPVTYKKTEYSARLSFKNPDTKQREQVETKRTVYQNSRLDPNLVIPKGTRYSNGKLVRHDITNLELMSAGKAPFIQEYDQHGHIILVPVELHHLSGREGKGGTKYFTGAARDGSVVEISALTHDRNKRALHIGTPSFRVGTDGKKSRDAYQYDSFRRNYWKDRANGFKNA